MRAPTFCIYLYAVNSIYDWCVFEVIVVFPGQDCFRQDTFRLTTQRIQVKLSGVFKTNCFVDFLVNLRI